jgi:hypothetical protein
MVESNKQPAPTNEEWEEELRDLQYELAVLTSLGGDP